MPLSLFERFVEEEGVKGPRKAILRMPMSHELHEWLANTPRALANAVVRAGTAGKIEVRDAIVAARLITVGKSRENPRGWINNMETLRATVGRLFRADAKDWSFLRCIWLLAVAGSAEEALREAMVCSGATGEPETEPLEKGPTGEPGPGTVSEIAARALAEAALETKDKEDDEAGDKPKGPSAADFAARYRQAREEAAEQEGGARERLSPRGGVREAQAPDAELDDLLEALRPGPSGRAPRRRRDDDDEDDYRHDTFDEGEEWDFHLRPYLWCAAMRRANSADARRRIAAEAVDPFLAAEPTSGVLSGGGGVANSTPQMAFAMVSRTLARVLKSIIVNGVAMPEETLVRVWEAMVASDSAAEGPYAFKDCIRFLRARRHDPVGRTREEREDRLAATLRESRKYAAQAAARTTGGAASSTQGRGAQATQQHGTQQQHGRKDERSRTGKRSFRK